MHNEEHYYSKELITIHNWLPMHISQYVKETKSSKMLQKFSKLEQLGSEIHFLLG